MGSGCHRLSEIAGRLGKPATSLARPLARLLDLGLVRRDLPFGATTRDSKRTAYRLDDPFLRFWFRFVEPNRSRLQARLVAETADRRRLLLGEVKWSDRVDRDRELAALKRKADNLPLAEGRQVHLALWVRSGPRRVGSSTDCFTPRDVLRALR